MSKDAGFPYFAKMVYDHAQKYPRGTMGAGQLVYRDLRVPDKGDHLRDIAAALPKPTQ